MSFRKRSERIGIPAVPQRGPGGISTRPVPERGVPSIRQPHVHRTPGVPEQKNPAIRPSLTTSQETVSTGVPDLDKILLHQGLPLGNSLLVEEAGPTDFSSVILKSFASQGIIHNRIEKNVQHSHVIVVGLPPEWLKELFGVYKGSSKDQKKAKVKENEEKVSVSNIVDEASTRDDSMKIAWRYGLNKQAAKDAKENDNTYEHYNSQFDVTQKLLPGPSSQDITFLPLDLEIRNSIKTIHSVIKTQLRGNESKVIRLVIPSILHPSIYNPEFSNLTKILPFIHSLRALTREFNHNLVICASIATDFYPRDSLFCATLESLMDAVIHLQPFNQDMITLIEKAYKNEPTKVQQGLVDIIKVPVLSDKGMMLIHNAEYAFKNSRKRFEIEEWGIPVDDVEDNNNSQGTGQTTKNIDF